MGVGDPHGDQACDGHAHDGHAHAGHAHGHAASGPGERHVDAGGPHGHRHSHAASARRLGLSLGLTLAIMVAEAVGGFVSGSLALVSDAGHMLTDAAALGLALLAVLFAARPADDKRTFGFRRLEVLAAQFNVAFLVLLTGWIAWEAMERLRNPPPAIGVATMGVVAFVGLVTNVVILLWLRHDHSLNARSAFLHVLGDAIASVAVLGGAAVIWVRPDWAWVDPALSLAIALLILWGAWGLSREITDILMEAVPRHIDLSDVCRTMHSASGVEEVHDVHVWTISSGLYALSAHVVVRDDAMGHNDSILTEVKGRLRECFGIDHTTIQIESAGYAHIYDHVHDTEAGRRATP
jgi:cobalt-zinc-cadmium efflux system protein